MAKFGALARRASSGLRAGAFKARGSLSRVGARAAVGIRRAREAHGETIMGSAIGAGAVTAIVAVDEITGLPPGISAAGTTILVVAGGAAAGPRTRRHLSAAANMAGGIALYFAERAIVKFVRERPPAVQGDF
jgi:hypothetical protein